MTWWTSTFFHMHKRHRFTCDQVIQVRPNFTLRLLHGIGYQRNISAARLIDHWQIAKKFRAHARSLSQRPDVILCSFPTIDFSVESVRFARASGSKVVLDIRDLWPDIFLHVVPKFVKPVARLALGPYFRRAAFALGGADAIFAVNDGFVNWGLDRARRKRNSFDRAFPMAYSSAAPMPEQQDRARQFWRSLGVDASEATFKAIFIGTVGRQFEFEAVVEAAKSLADSHFQVIICGTGDLLDEVRALSRGATNILFPGWVGAAEIWTLMRMAQVGLAPYHNEDSFLHSLPNKSIEYLSAGLPIVSSLPGALARLLMERNCGITYSNNNASELRAALELLRNQSSLRRAMAANAKAVFDASFRAETVYSEMICLLEKLATESARRP